MKSVKQTKKCYDEPNYREDVRYFLSYLQEVLTWIIGVLLVFTFLFRTVIVSGSSMERTLFDGDCLLLLGNVFYSEPQKGDIVVISKQSYDGGKSIIKRVIATEGQVVDIDFEEGVVYVDGQALDEPYTNTPTNLAEGMTFPLTVDEGCIFVLGDNRNVSKDSRSTEIGLVDTREIVGKVICLFFPGNNKGTMERDFKRIGGVS